MKNKMVKVIISILALVMCILFQSLMVFAASEELADDEDSMYNEVYEEYKDDEQFCMMLEDYGEEYAREFIQNVIDVDSEISSLGKARGGGGNVCYQYVTNIKQTQTYNCGSTTVLQTLYGVSSQSNVSGSTDKQKIATLDAEYNVASQGSMYVYQVCDALNKYDKYNSVYVYKVGTSFTQAQFEDCIATSLTYCKPVVLHAKTGYFTYYGTKNTGHYLSLDYVNRTTDKVRIVDCNYNPDYYGVHTGIALSEAYNSISKTSERYLIY